MWISMQYLAFSHCHVWDSIHIVVALLAWETSLNWNWLPFCFINADFNSSDLICKFCSLEILGTDMEWRNNKLRRMQPKLLSNWPLTRNHDNFLRNVCSHKNALGDSQPLLLFLYMSLDGSRGRKLDCLILLYQIWKCFTTVMNNKERNCVY